MLDETTEQDLKDRVTLIERMIAEGRRTTESWGWCFVLWGIAFYAATAWSAWGHTVWAWPVTIGAAVIATVIVASIRSGRRPETTLGRSVVSVWIAFGVSISVLFLSLGLSGRITDLHLFVSIVSALLGMANGASGLILRWRVQLLCAAVWWAACVAACLGSEAESLIVFLIAIFLGQIAFGAYCMIVEAQQRKRRQPDRGPAHA
jgi:hypothetical protein